MTNYLTATPDSKCPIEQLEIDTPALGGPGGPMNWQAQSLLNRITGVQQEITAVTEAAENIDANVASSSASASAAYNNAQSAANSAAQAAASAAEAEAIVINDPATVRGLLGLANHQLVTLSASGRLLLGTTTDNGVDIAQFAGSVKFSAATNNAISITGTGSGTLRIGQYSNGVWFGTDATSGAAARVSFGNGNGESFRINADKSIISHNGIIVPNYANDAAAATAGVPVGAMYRTGTTLKVRSA